MKFDPVPIATSINMVTTSTSTGVYLGQIIAYAIQARWTGQPLGTIDLQVSNDIVKVDPLSLDPAANVVNWTTYSGASQSLIGSGSAGSFVWNAPYAGYSWVRLLYTQSSGSVGTLNAIFSGKG